MLPPSLLLFTACSILRVDADGRLVVRPEGAQERTVALHGAKIPSPPSPRVAEIIGRVGKAGQPPRCTFLAHDEASIEIYGWQDKSGDVWLDLAQVLVDQGLARGKK